VTVQCLVDETHGRDEKAKTTAAPSPALKNFIAECRLQIAQQYHLRFAVYICIPCLGREFQFLLMCKSCICM
jgi:hypothetical protein